MTNDIAQAHELRRVENRPARRNQRSEGVAGYLELALQVSAEDASAVPAIARSRNMSELARRVGMSRDGLYRALSKDGNPTWSTILKMTNALDLRFELHTVA